MRKSVKLSATNTAGAPTPDQLKAINGYALAEMGADQVYVRTAYLAHNGIDRDHEVFDDALLDDFARTLPGKGMFVRHPGGWDGDSGPGVGRWFAAQVVSVSLDEARVRLREPNLQFPPATAVAKLLEASFYVPRTNKNANLLDDIDAGVAGDVSIGFSAADRTSIRDANGNEIAMRLLGPGEAAEGSLVWLGAQPGARVHKSTSRGNVISEREMLLQKIKKLERDNAALYARLTGMAELLAKGGQHAVSPTVRDPDGVPHPLANPAITGREENFAVKAEPDDSWYPSWLAMDAVRETTAAEARRRSAWMQPERTPIGDLENPAITGHSAA